jgi:hypothetical protein
MRQEEKTREVRLRRMAYQRGYRLIRSGRRDPQAVDFNRYALFDVRTGGAVNPAIADRWIYSWSLDQVEDFLSDDGPKAGK